MEIHNIHVPNHQPDANYCDSNTTRVDSILGAMKNLPGRGLPGRIFQFALERRLNQLPACISYGEGS